MFFSGIGDLGGGQVYVTVEADEADQSVMLFNETNIGSAGGTGGGAGDGSETSLGIVIKWTYAGGVTDSGWQVGTAPITPAPTTESKQSVNDRIKAAANGQSVNKILFGPTGDCAVLQL